jgi:hypothetical protein
MRKAQAAIRDERAKQGLCADNIRQPNSDKRPSVVAAVRAQEQSPTSPATRRALLFTRSVGAGCSRVNKDDLTGRALGASNTIRQPG